MASSVSTLQAGDVVILHEDKLIPMKWPLGHIIKTYVGKDEIVRVIDINMTAHGVYKHPVTKIVLLSPFEN